MPKIIESTRRRRGGGGTMGVRAPASFYQRRDIEDKPYWPELPERKDSNQQTEHVETAKPTESAADTTTTAVTATATLQSTVASTLVAQTLDHADGARTTSAVPSTSDKGHCFNKKRRQRKKTSLDWSFSEGGENDSAFDFSSCRTGSSKKSTKLIRGKNSNDNLSAADVRDVTHRINASLVSPVSSFSSTAQANQKKMRDDDATAGDHDRNDNMHAKVDQAKQKPSWQSPYVAQTPQDASLATDPLPNSTLLSPLDAEHAPDDAPLQKLSRAEEEQNRKHEQYTQEWKKKYEEKDHEVENLKNKHALDKKQKEENYSKELSDTVHRMTLKWELDRRNYQQQLAALEKELAVCRNRLEHDETEKEQTALQYHDRAQSNAHTIERLCKENRGKEQECERLQKQLASSEATNRELQNLLVAQGKTQLDLDERERALDRREKVLAMREMESDRAMPTGTAAKASSGSKTAKLEGPTIPTQQRMVEPVNQPPQKSDDVLVMQAEGPTNAQKPGGDHSAHSPPTWDNYCDESRKSQSRRPKKCGRKRLHYLIPSFDTFGIDLTSAAKDSEEKKPRKSR